MSSIFAAILVYFTLLVGFTYFPVIASPGVTPGRGNLTEIASASSFANAHDKPRNDIASNMIEVGGEFSSPEILSQSPEAEKSYPYSSLVILPYTSRITGLAGNKVIPEREANIRLSSYSAMVTAAARILYENKMAPQIIALGEHTFGEEYPSTADLMKDYLLKRGVPENAVTTLGNLQDTDEQLQVLKAQNPVVMGNPLYILMDFHQDRVKMVISDNKLPGKTRSAEDIFMEYFEKKHAGLKDSDPEEYKRLITHHRRQLQKFTPLKIHIVETILKTAMRTGPLRKSLFKVLRNLRGWASVTDYHNLTSGEKHLAQARQAIAKGKLKPGDIK